MRIVTRVVTEVVAITQLTIEVAVDDLDQQQLEQQLAILYRTPVDIEVINGSATVRISTVLDVTRASQIGEDELSRALGMPVEVALWVMNSSNVSIPYDQPCEEGFYCSAAAAYACPKATWNDLTGQQDSSTCVACPSPGRMTTQSEGTASIDGCVCQEQYYKAADGGCEVCSAHTHTHTHTHTQQTHTNSHTHSASHHTTPHHTTPHHTT
jgi:hypothetical protein